VEIIRAELPGQMNGHAAGIIMKEVVRRAIISIRRQLRTFEASEKQGINKAEDFVTTADKAAQEIYLRTLRQCFPGYGVVAEEDDLSLPCEIEGEDLFFTVDPLDGTKAFMRRQSHAVGTMISLVRKGTVVSAYVGDVMTQEIYGFRPGSERVHRISEYNETERLQYIYRPLRDQYVSLRSEPEDFSEDLRKVAKGTKYQGAFKAMEISGGSIGVDMARLWKGEIGGIVLEPFINTPWDYCPVMGISQRLGFIEVEVVDGQPQVMEPVFKPEPIRRDHECFIIHRSNLPELEQAFSNL
jgi:fructose-1,6-bisphosphatase/inositol monophosphatase family enzyme